ncbi:MAG: 50S ribosomal protein L27 [Candidatus Colwellbacteria bacterium]|nr:50S ribosomal protein L27 [Candidatus Colwellbacteria bacterium]
MAHTKSGGSTKLGRDSAAQRLGVKLQDGQSVNPGQIIIRQRGSKYLAGANIKIAGDDTLYAGKSGVVKFYSKKKVRFDGHTRYVTVVSVV